jgi:hypothetical protein
MTVCCEASYQSNLLPRRFFPTEEMLTEQLNNGTQEPRVLNIYRNYLFTMQENQLLALHINQRLAYAYITIIGQLNGN